MLTRVAQDAQRALLAVEQADGLLDDEPVKAAYELLGELIGQDFDVDQDGVPRLHRGTRSGRIISTIDPEMQHGRKSSPVSGLTGTSCPPRSATRSEPLIMAVHVAPGGETDGPQAKHLIDSAAAGASPGPDPRRHRVRQRVGALRARRARRARCSRRSRKARSLEDRVGKRDFTIDPAAGTVTCPAGHTATITTSKKGVRTARISRAVCGGCPLKDQCCPGRPNRQIALGEHEELMIAARQALNDPATAAHLRHTRPRIERLLGLLAHRYGARKSRYIGSDKARLQASWAAALVNLNPIGRHLATGTT